MLTIKTCCGYYVFGNVEGGRGMHLSFSNTMTRFCLSRQELQQSSKNINKNGCSRRGGKLCDQTKSASLRQRSSLRAVAINLTQISDSILFFISNPVNKLTGGQHSRMISEHGHNYSFWLVYIERISIRLCSEQYSLLLELKKTWTYFAQVVLLDKDCFGWNHPKSLSILLCSKPSFR